MTRLRTLLLGSALMSLLLAPPAAADETEDAKLTAFYRAYLDVEIEQRPSDATRLGDHRYDDRLDDLSPKARAAAHARLLQTIAELPRRIDRTKLTRGGQIDYEILEHALNYTRWVTEETNPYENDPRPYGEAIGDSVFLLLTQSTTPKDQNVRNAASRIRQIPRVVAAARESLKNPPRIWTEQAIRANAGSINFYEKGIFDITGEGPGSELQAATREIVPVLREYRTFLEKDLLPRSTGEWRIGKDRFYRKLILELNAGLTADRVLADAEAEAERVERELAVVARQLWHRHFPGKPLPPDDAAGRRDLVKLVIAEVGNDHGSATNLLKDAEASVAKIKTFIAAKDILRLPEPDRCKLIEMPEFQRGFSVAYLNPAPPLDPKSASHYAISPPPRNWDDRRVRTFLQEYNRHMLQILTIHEAYPGHYVQLEYGNRHPSLIRKVLYSGVFAEGWAVYTEQVMLDQGYGDGDLALRLNQLKFYLRAVINAILDHKMHCANMTDEEALALLMGRGFQSEGEAVGKVQRAKLSSCQLSTYFVGRMAFYRLRQSVQRELGDRFELGRYHEAVLDHGTLPVKYLPELTRERLKQPR